MVTHFTNTRFSHFISRDRYILRLLDWLQLDRTGIYLYQKGWKVYIMAQILHFEWLDNMLLINFKSILLDQQRWFRMHLHHFFHWLFLHRIILWDQVIFLNFHSQRKMLYVKQQILQIKRRMNHNYHIHQMKLIVFTLMGIF